MSSSSEEINPAELQREEEQHRQEAANKIRVAEEKKARRDVEKERKWIEEEAWKKAEEEARKQAEEEATEERRTKERRTKERRKKTPGTTIICPMEPKGGSSHADSTKSAGWRPGPNSPCGNCMRLDIECKAPGSKKSKTCQQCKVSHIICREPGAPSKATKRSTIDLMSPRGGKDRKCRRQKSPDYREKKSDGEADEEAEEKEDALGALVEAIVGLSAQYEEERRANAEYSEVPSRITYPSFPSFFASTWLITENLSCSARKKEEICLSASELTASLMGQTICALPPSTGLVLVPS
ncbi:hypothetical protein BDN67DRAFT_1017661 [Paxillus ammoniavirescens]|nr:hypothetical protein BDN67DRAFT_1017661 [Paxillus ammoniavirescens]